MSEEDPDNRDGSGMADKLDGLEVGEFEGSRLDARGMFSI